jgi:hypothetical protein
MHGLQFRAHANESHELVAMHEQVRRGRQLTLVGTFSELSQFPETMSCDRRCVTGQEVLVGVDADDQQQSRTTASVSATAKHQTPYFRHFWGVHARKIIGLQSFGLRSLPDRPAV